MAQLTFSDFEKDLQRKKSRKAEFLELLDRLVPWASLIALIEPYYPKVPDGSGRRPYALDSIQVTKNAHHCGIPKGLSPFGRIPKGSALWWGPGRSPGGRCGQSPQWG